jgi:toxin ParE1/3/4
MKIDYSPEALDDLAHIELYYSERASAEVAEEFIGRVLTTLERLIARNPQAGRRRPELDPESRSFPVLPYVVFYRIERRRVYVQRILHGRRDIKPPIVSLFEAV